MTSLTYDNFVAAKNWCTTHNAMRLIDDEIGIFHKRLVTTDDLSNSYYDIWEDIKLPKRKHDFNYEIRNYCDIGPWNTGSDGEEVPLPKRSDHDIALPFGKKRAW